jgi:trehalose 6-phosphate phosphatase
MREPGAPGAAPFVRNSAFFLDIDGTLLDIVALPSAVRAGAADYELLAALYEAAGGAVALVSGRPIAGIDRIFAPLKLPAAGQHGVERRDARGRIHRHAMPSELWLEAIAPLRRYAAAHEGIIFEDKGLSVALHFRLAPRLEKSVQALVRAAVERLGERYEVLPGKMVLELRPSGRDKGVAIEEFMREKPFARRKPVFLGDDLSDEYGFMVVNRLGGCSVKVGAGRSAAHWSVPDPAAVRAWLAQWIEAASGRVPAH